MNRLQKSFFALVALVSMANITAGSSVCATPANAACGTGGMPYFSIRSQGVNTVREMVGWEDLINQCDKDCFYGAFYVTGEYTQSFRPARLASCLFGADVTSGNCSTSSTSTTSTTTSCNTGCNTGSNCNSAFLTVSGSRAATRGANDWLADYFGLPTDFVSTISFSPRIRNFVADVGFYLGLSEWADGLWFRLHLPITNTRWDLRACETVTTPGANGYVAGYFIDDAVTRANLLSSALSFLGGCSQPTIVGTTTTTPATFDTLKFSKIGTSDGNCKGRSRTRLADVEMALGYNFVCCEDYYFGLSIRSEAPTGNKPCGEFFFEPVVGNGGSWTIGGGLNAKAVLWRCDDSESTFSLYLDANITHLFKACQTRVFDLCGKPNSRYMLAEKLTSTITNGLSGSTTAAVATGGTLSTLQFANAYTSVANLTASQVKVSAAVQGDVALKFEYANGCGFTWDIGYNFWGRSCEKICLQKGCTTSTALNGSTWALKGDAHVYGFGLASPFTPVALGATESCANIHGGTNGFNDAVTATNAIAQRNPGIDLPQFAYSATLAEILTATVGGGTADQTRTSIQPKALTLADVDFSGTKGISNKVFTHFNYAWTDCEDWTPFLGVGVSAEFGGGNCNNNNSCNTSCSTSTTTTTSTNCNTSCGSNTGSCKKCAVNQWAVWIKGGVAFN